MVVIGLDKAVKIQKGATVFYKLKPLATNSSDIGSFITVLLQRWPFRQDIEDPSFQS